MGIGTAAANWMACIMSVSWLSKNLLALQHHKGANRFEFAELLLAYVMSEGDWAGSEALV